MNLRFVLNCFLLMPVLASSTLAQDEPPAELANRTVVEAFYRAAYAEHDSAAARSFLAPGLIQHHPEIADGVDGMAAYIAATPASRAIKRVLTDGDYVIVQAHQTTPDDPRGAVTGDIFRLAGGRIAEQWGIVHPITPSPDATNPNDVFGSNSAPYPTPTSVAQERRNLALATGFYHVAMNEKDWAKATSYLGEYYQQHSVYMADGHEAFRGLVERIQREFPNNLGLVKQSFADGDMVVLNLEVTRDKGGLAYNVIELMRLEDDKVVEHWDIFQRLEGVQAKNSNGYW